MPNNNNPLTEIIAGILACVLIIGASLLVWAGKIDFTAATLAYTLAVGVFAGNLALKAPSPAQQAALLQLTAQALQTQQAQPDPAPSVPPQDGSVIASSWPAPTNVAPTVMTGTSTMPQAMLMTQDMPAVKPPQ